MAAVSALGVPGPALEGLERAAFWAARRSFRLLIRLNLTLVLARSRGREQQESKKNPPALRAGGSKAKPLRVGLELELRRELHAIEVAREARLDGPVPEDELGARIDLRDRAPDQVGVHGVHVLGLGKEAVAQAFDTTRDDGGREVDTIVGRLREMQVAALDVGAEHIRPPMGIANHEVEGADGLDCTRSIDDRIRD